MASRLARRSRMASLTALFSAYRSPCAPRLQSASLRVAPLALAARPGARQVLPFSTRVSVPKASAAVADWVSQEYPPAESEAEAQSFSSLFEEEGDDIDEEEVADETLLVENCGLSEVTVEALRARGIARLFPVQKRVLEPAMEGRDLIARARTGSGKTLAFALPATERVMAERQGRLQARRAPLVLVLAPTRELATQVEREFASVAPTLRTLCVYGGTSIETQRRVLSGGCDVVVGTPGRVIDLVNQGLLRLDEVKVAVLDEADQMLAVGFAEDTERILAETPRERQTMLFSATTPAWIKKLVERFLKDPLTVDLGGAGAATGRLAESISARAILVTPESRRTVLADVLTVHGGGRAIVFTQTKREADEVAAGVAGHLPCAALHGDMSQHEREKVLGSFRKGALTVLVATDVAARGLDIPDVDLVVHYQPPHDPEAFLHRSGRTGRAGKSGTAIVMFTPRELPMLRRVLHESNTKGVEVIPAPTPVQVMGGAARKVMGRLDGVPEEVRAFFRPVAQRILASREPQEALEAALAALSGVSEAPGPRSLITLEEGFITLRMTAPRGRIVRPTQVSAVAGHLAEASAKLDGRLSLGRIRMLPARPGTNNEEGAAFDVPAEAAAALIEAAQGERFVAQGLAVDMPEELPSMVDLYARDGHDIAVRGPNRSLAPRGAPHQYGGGGYGRRGSGGDGYGRRGSGRDGSGGFRRYSQPESSDWSSQKKRGDKGGRRRK